MHQHLCARAEQLKQGGIREFFDKAAKLENIINLGIGEPDFDVPRDVKEAAIRAVSAGKNHYTANSGIKPLRDAVSTYVSKYGVICDPDKNVIITCGGMGAVSMALLCSIEPGNEVIIQDPQWLNYSSQIRFAGGVAVPVPVYEENGFAIKEEDVERAITDNSRVLLLNSPNNPTGGVMGYDDIKALAQLAVKHDLLVISDEVYCELLYDGRKHISIASFPGMAERTIVVNSLSKTFAMTGWRIGFAIGPAHFIQQMVYLQENFTACAPAPAQYAAAYALDKMSLVEERRKEYARRRELIVSGLNRIQGISCIMPAGAFYAFPNFEQWAKNSTNTALALLEYAGVAVVPGSCFGRMGEKHLRFSYASSDSNIIEALNRIDTYAGKYFGK